LSWIVTTPDNAGYAAAKAALWSLTNALRLELATRRIAVVAVHCAMLDTEMSARLKGRKVDPSDVARQSLDGVESGAYEVLTDRPTRMARELLSGPLHGMYPALRATPTGS
jgi:short-subunit dehydrogenase